MRRVELAVLFPLFRFSMQNFISLIDTLLGNGQFKKAADIFESCNWVSLERDEFLDLRLKYAEALICIGRYSDAFVQYKMVIAENPLDPAIACLYARSLLYYGSDDQAFIAREVLQPVLQPLTYENSFWTHSAYVLAACAAALTDAVESACEMFCKAYGSDFAASLREPDLTGIELLKMKGVALPEKCIEDISSCLVHWNIPDEKVSGLWYDSGEKGDVHDKDS